MQITNKSQVFLLYSQVYSEVETRKSQVFSDFLKLSLKIIKIVTGV